MDSFASYEYTNAPSTGPHSRQGTRSHLQDSSDTLEALRGKQAIPGNTELVPPPIQFRIQTATPLEWKDVSALIINKMVGTGVFTGPFAVLQATNNKYIAIVLWVIGFLYTISSTFVYLEYARDLPYTGGELIYLDDLFSSQSSWRGFRGPYFNLLAYTLYATYFMLVYTTANNSLAFAWQVWEATNPTDGEVPDQRVLRLIAVFITTLICGLLYLSASESRRANRWTAYMKVALLGAVIIAGWVYAPHQHAAHSPWHTAHTELTLLHETLTGQLSLDPGNGAILAQLEQIQADLPRTNVVNWSPALLAILFAFNGWENATLVAGEIPRYEVLRRGFFIGVLLVGSAYLTIIVTLCFSFPWDTIVNLTSSPNFNYIAHYFGGSAGAHRAAAVITALSAVGNMISVTYTCVAVNRVIGLANILPWSPIWRSSSPARNRSWKAAIEKNNAQQSNGIASNRFSVPRGTPEGGVMVHWFATVFWICVSARFENFLAAASFTGGAMIYTHCFAEAAAGFGFLWFRHDLIKRPPPREWNGGEPFKFPYIARFLYTALGLFTGVFSLAVIIGAFFHAATRVYFYVAIGSIVATSLYWLAFVNVTNAEALLGRLGLDLEQVLHGRDDRDDSEHACDVCDDQERGEVAHRHAQDGYMTFNRIWVRDSEEKWAARWFRWFGGPDLRTDKPVKPTSTELKEMPVSSRTSADGVPRRRYSTRSEHEY